LPANPAIGEVILRHWSNGGIRLSSHGQDFATVTIRLNSGLFGAGKEVPHACFVQQFTALGLRQYHARTHASASESGAGGLGVPVVRALNTVQIGMGVEAGFVIVLLAVILDRIIRIRRA
jgi:hypothetical protein